MFIRVCLLLSPSLLCPPLSLPPSLSLSLYRMGPAYFSTATPELTVPLNAAAIAGGFPAALHPIMHPDALMVCVSLSLFGASMCVRERESQRVY
jgi:hypothetical protein